MLVRDRRTSSANGACGRHDRHGTVDRHHDAAILFFHDRLYGVVRLGLYSPIWGLCVYGAAILTAAALVSVSPYCWAISQGDNSRFSQIDGLRGYLALGVFITHAGSMRQWPGRGDWWWPPSSFFTLAGMEPVALFFMITAFLFWGKAIRSRGRIDPRWLLVSRLRRLAPLYLWTIPVFLLCVGIESDWTLHTDVGRLLLTVGRWLLIGFGGTPNVNGVEIDHLYPQVWTLRYEWLFYAALPVIAFLWRVPGSIALVVATIAAVKFQLVNPVILNFAAGIAVAELVAHRPKITWLRTWWAALASLVVLALPAVYGHRLGVYGTQLFSWKITLCLTPFFVCVCYHNNIFGLLSNRPARLLGATSYSIYLLHVFALYLLFLAVSRFTLFGTLTAYVYWPMILSLTVLLVTVSVLTFKFIEQPWMSNQRAEGPSTNERIFSYTRNSGITKRPRATIDEAEEVYQHAEN